MEPVKVQPTFECKLAAQKNFTFQTIERAFTGKGYSGTDYANAFDAVEDFNWNSTTWACDEPQFTQKLIGVAEIFGAILSGYKDITVGNLRVSMEVKEDSITFSNQNDSSKKPFTVNKSLPQFIKYIKESIRATAEKPLKFSSLQPKKIIDLHDQFNLGTSIADNHIYKNSPLQYQLSQFFPESKVNETISEFIEAVKKIGEGKILELKDFIMIEEGLASEKKIVCTDKNHNKLFAIPKQTFKDLGSKVVSGESHIH